MTNEQKASFVFAAAARAIIIAQGMTAENEQRKRRGESMAYGEKAFYDIIEQEGIGHNAVIITLR